MVWWGDDYGGEFLDIWKNKYSTKKSSLSSNFHSRQSILSSRTKEKKYKRGELEPSCVSVEKRECITWQSLSFEKKTPHRESTVEGGDALG
jgi:hypothetical protein